MTGSDGKIYITDTTRNLLFSGSAEPNSKIEIIINGLNVGKFGLMKRPLADAGEPALFHRRPTGYHC